MEIQYPSSLACTTIYMLLSISQGTYVAMERMSSVPDQSEGHIRPVSLFNSPFDIEDTRDTERFSNDNKWVLKNSMWPMFSTSGRRSQGGKVVVNNAPANTADKNKWSQFTSWGKRDTSFVLRDDTGKLWTAMSMQGTRDDTDNTKNWGKVLVWGKRNGFNNRKKWKEMSAWGKRNNIENTKKWKEMASWGKRDDIDYAKKWKEMASWGKRDDIDYTKKWKEMATWGKRDDIDYTKKWKEMNVSGDHFLEAAKNLDTSLWQGPEQSGFRKKWKSLTAWGKREAIFDRKRKEMSAWGQRKGDIAKNVLKNATGSYREDVTNVQKKWKEMTVWGKRSGTSPDIMKLEGLPLWGKRTLQRVRNWRDIDMWGKRPSWSKTGFTSWGKRSGNGFPSARKLSPLKSLPDQDSRSNPAVKSEGIKSQRFLDINKSQL